MAAKILASGSYLPARIITNDELSRLMATSDAWIRKHIGVSERRFAAPGEGVSDMAREAARLALDSAGLSAADIDAIVFATATPEYHAPGSGVLLQHKLGCRYIPAFDVRNTSPGFLYSLDLADGLIATKRYEVVLVVGSEVHSTGLDFSDHGKKMAVIFGDGCGCFLLGRSDSAAHGFADFVLHSDGTHYNRLWCQGPSSLLNPRVSLEQLETGICYPKMDGRFVFDNAVSDMTGAVQELLARNSLALDDVDWLIAHQANLRILEAVTARLNYPAAKAPHNIERYGNTSSASIPILFDELWRAGKIRAGQQILLTSFGSGFCWGAGLLRV